MGVLELNELKLNANSFYVESITNSNRIYSNINQVTEQISERSDSKSDSQNQVTEAVPIRIFEIAPFSDLSKILNWQLQLHNYWNWELLHAEND